ncbi:N-acetylmuramoyl-L-alanine amidase [Bacteroidia bacterium]|nr:N-acetylmuramoyl-L-alanine amidase [Bacteroidia bacterium]
MNYRVKNKLFLILFAFLPALFTEAGNKEKQFVVVIDPGHGGHDTGAPGASAKEKHIVLAVSKLLGEYINKKHPEVKVAFTRKTDVFIELDDRANFANKSKADLFISIHTNSVKKNKKPNGAETYTFGLARTQENLEVAMTENAAILLEDNYEERYEGFNPNSSESYIIFEYMQNKFVDQSIEFASYVQDELIKTAKRKDRGVRQSSFLVLRKASMPRVLVELDFISNPSVEGFMKSQKGQETMAKSISNAFDKYYKKYKPQGGESNLQPTIAVTSTEKAVYKVQILASDVELAKNSRQLKGYKADFYYEKGLYKYTYGESSNWNEISQIRKSLLKDFKDAFIITFKDGKKVEN